MLGVVGRQTEQQALGVTDQKCLDHTVKWTLKSSKIRLNSNTIYLRVYILREGSSHYYSTMVRNILVLVRRNKKTTESNRKYERVTVKAEKAEYGHVLTHAPS